MINLWIFAPDLAVVFIYNTTEMQVSQIGEDKPLRKMQLKNDYYVNKIEYVLTVVLAYIFP